MSLGWIVFWVSLGVFCLIALKVWLLMKWVNKQKQPESTDKRS